MSELATIDQNASALGPALDRIPILDWNVGLLCEPPLGAQYRALFRVLKEATGTGQVFGQLEPSPNKAADPDWDDFRLKASQYEREIPDCIIDTINSTDLSACIDAPKVRIIDWMLGRIPKLWVPQCNHESILNFFISRQACKFAVESGIAEDRVAYLPPGVDLAFFAARDTPYPFKSQKSFKFLFAQGTSQLSGFSALIKTYAACFSALDDLCLVICRGSLEEELDLKKIAAALDFANAPALEVIEKPLNPAARRQLFASCDLAVFPFLAEQSGSRILEAMAAGTPVAATNFGIGADLGNTANSFPIACKTEEIKDDSWHGGENVTIAHPQPEAIEEALRSALKDQGANRRLAQKAREDVANNNDWLAVGKKLCQDINQAIAHPPAQPLVQERAVGSPRASEALFADLQLRWTGACLHYSGYGKVTRNFLMGLHELGAHVALQSMAVHEQFEKELASNVDLSNSWNQIFSHRIKSKTLVCFHPATSAQGHGIFSITRRRAGYPKHFVGYTMFETDRLPRYWAEECNNCDEVWVPSEFNRQTFTQAGVDPAKIRVIPLGVDSSLYRGTKTPYPIPNAKGFNFLAVFEWSKRKGWDVLLDAFCAAFSPNDDVSLTIKAYASGRSVAERLDAYFESRGLNPKQCPKIIVLDAFITEKDMPSLYAAADAFVLPSRGEGWGLPYMEAMASRLPTIATRWSGHLDFMNDGNSLLIDIDGLGPVEADDAANAEGYYSADQNWALPNLEHTTMLMQKVVNEPEFAKKLGDRAAHDIQELWDNKICCRKLAKACRELETPKTTQTEVQKIDELLVWSGPLLDPSGYADEGRNFIFGLDAHSKAIDILTMEASWSDRRVTLNSQEADTLARLAVTSARLPFVHLQHVFAEIFAPSERARLNIGRTMYETDRLPESWVAGCNRMDEIWVPSDFNLETFAFAGVPREKLFKIPGAIDADRFRANKGRLILEGKRGFNFLSVFDWTLRKGWDVLLSAYLKAFRAQDDVCLMLKVYSSYGDSPQDLMEKIHDYIENHHGIPIDEAPDIVILANQYSEPEMRQLFSSCDAYVMPTRGEGWGRPYMEAMACGLPTIGTAWGGSTEFMNAENSYLIDYEMVEVSAEAASEAILFQGHNWAEPSADHLAEIMQRVVLDRKQAQALGRRAQEEVLAKYDRRLVAQMMVDRLRAIL